MSDPLFNKVTSHQIAPNEVMTDKIGRDCWAFYFAAQVGFKSDKPEIWVKRITNGKLAREPSVFGVEFFPDYEIRREPNNVISALGA